MNKLHIALLAVGFWQHNIRIFICLNETDYCWQSSIILASSCLCSIFKMSMKILIDINIQDFFNNCNSKRIIYHHYPESPCFVTIQKLVSLIHITFNSVHLESAALFESDLNARCPPTWPQPACDSCLFAVHLPYSHPVQVSTVKTSSSEVLNDRGKLWFDALWLWIALVKCGLVVMCGWTAFDDVFWTGSAIWAAYDPCVLPSELQLLCVGTNKKGRCYDFLRFDLLPFAMVSCCLGVQHGFCNLPVWKWTVEAGRSSQRVRARSVTGAGFQSTVLRCSVWVALGRWCRASAEVILPAPLQTARSNRGLMCLRAPCLSSVAGFEGCSMVPSIYPLETLHNSLSLKQVNEFLAGVCESAGDPHTRTTRG